MRTAAQLYTLRDYCKTEDDFADSMDKVAAMGYTAVQISAVGPIAPERLRYHCDRNGLAIPVTHTPPQRILNDTDAVIAEHRVLGAPHIGIGSMPREYERTPTGVDSFIADFLPAAERIAEAGLSFHYHNHDFELARAEGQTLLERMAARMPADLMGFIIDTYWLQAGGADPAAWIRKLAGRVPCVHLKDMVMIDGQRAMAPVLSGNMNFTAILEACAAAGTEWLIVEQDYCQGSPFDCLAESYANLALAGYR